MKVRVSLKWAHIKDTTPGNKGSRWESKDGQYVAEWTTDEAYYETGDPLWILSEMDDDTGDHEQVQSFSSLAECKVAAEKRANR